MSLFRQLSEWPDGNRPLVMVRPAGLEILIQGYRMDNPADLERLVRLGESTLSFVEYRVD